MRVNYDNEPDRVCAACGKKLNADEGVGTVLKGLSGPLCGPHYREFKKKLQDKEKGK
jgi:hypothetical protein